MRFTAAGLSILCLVGRATAQQEIRLVITKVRREPNTDGAGLSHVSFFNWMGMEISGVSVSNPGGSSPNEEGPMMLVDAGGVETKWIDINYPLSWRSELVFTLPFLPNFNQNPTTLELFTSRDQTKRDPVSWTVDWRDVCGNWSTMATVTNFAAPTARKASYTGSSNRFSLSVPAAVDPSTCPQ